MKQCVNPALSEAIEAAGSILALARFLRVADASIHTWCQKGTVPPFHADRIEKEYGIDRRQLASKDTVWPEDGFDAVRDKLGECIGEQLQ